MSAAAEDVAGMAASPDPDQTLMVADSENVAPSVKFPIDGFIIHKVGCSYRSKLEGLRKLWVYHICKPICSATSILEV